MVSALSGTVVADRYDVIELVGAGGMGEVYRARDRDLDEIVALKIIRTDRSDDANLIARFRHEVKLARRVTHANVARTFELGSADGVVFCTMELIEGESLARRLSSQRRLPISEATAIASAVCAGLAAAHAADVIHRDIKPDNILLAGDRAVITDFGVAAIRVRGEGELSGTPAYMAPEQARGEPPTPAADVYAVGVILYEMLSGKRAFDGELTAILVHKQELERMVIVPGEVPAELCDVIARATARDVEQRYQTADDLRRALEPWARTAQLPTPHRAQGARKEVHPVIVVAPRAADDSAPLYLAKAVHEELLARLARRPMIRVLPRVAPEPGALVLEQVAGHSLRVKASRDGDPVLELDLPLDVARVGESAQTIVDTAVALLEQPPAPRPVEDRIRATDLLLRARDISGANIARTPEAIELATEAARLAPDDPRIASTLAVLNVRVAFFLASADAHLLERAEELARTALYAAPELAESHVAMGHVTLHGGQPEQAASHYRRAIACSPHSAEAHEYMGRMLLEAGFLEPAMARLEDALQIAPHLTGIHWDIARAWALEQRWDRHDALVAQLVRLPGERTIARARFAWWRGDVAAASEVRKNVTQSNAFDRRLLEAMFDVYLEGAWPRVGAAIVAGAMQQTSPNRRRRAFVAQLAAEAAGFAGDTMSCARLIELALDDGLFDLHWLERCPHLASFRDTTAYPPIRTFLRERATAILDAFYGDHVVGTVTATVVAPSTVAARPASGARPQAAITSKK